MLNNGFWVLSPHSRIDGTSQFGNLERVSFQSSSSVSCLVFWRVLFRSWTTHLCVFLKAVQPWTNLLIKQNFTQRLIVFHCGLDNGGCAPLDQDTKRIFWGAVFCGFSVRFWHHMIPRQSLWEGALSRKIQYQRRHTTSGLITSTWLRNLDAPIMFVIGWSKRRHVSLLRAQDKGWRRP